MAATENRGFSLGLFIFVLAIIGLGSGFFLQKKAFLPPPPLQAAQPIINPNTFRFETDSSFKVEPVDKVDRRCDAVSATVPELGYSQSFSGADLKAGAQGRIKPSKLGTFQMSFSCNGTEIGATPLSVVIGGELSSDSNNRRWVLTVGSVIYRDGSSFALPVMVTAEQRRGVDTWVPSSVLNDVHFALRDKNGQLSGSPEIVIDHNTAISKPLLVPFPPEVKYSLVAYNTEDGESSNEVESDWRKIGPKIDLVVFPKELTMYAAPVSSATASVYLAHEGARVIPSEKTDVLLSAPGTIKSDPDSKLSLTPKDPVGLYQAKGATAKGELSLALSEPKMNLSSTIPIHVLSPARFVIAAAIAGIFGVIVARNKALFEQKWYLIILEIGCAAICAFLLYGADILGWFKAIGLGEFTLSVLSAICIGLVGGYLGIAVFKGIAALFKFTA